MGSVAVVVPSFNRPRMLREALASIVGASEVFIADDGSTFDVVALAAEFGVPAENVVIGPQIAPAWRVRTTNCGRLINECLGRVTADYVGYCCDDDLLAPDWLEAAAKALDADPGSHMVRGDWRQFNDGESIEQSTPCNLEFIYNLTTGNFMHRAICFEQCKSPWPTDTVTCHDAVFLDCYLNRHQADDIRHVGVLAGYRRQHPTNMIRWTRRDGRRYMAEVEALFAGGRMLD